MNQKNYENMQSIQRKAVPVIPVLLAAHIDKFWSLVDRGASTGCWLWMGGKNGDGYGYLSISKTKCLRAHRVSWTLTNGEIPDNLCVLHKCDVRDCVNPDHLFLGTKYDNSMDAKKKKRHGHLDNHPRSILTSKDAEVIRKRYNKGGVTQEEIAKEYGVHRNTIWWLLKGATWKPKEAY